MFNRLRHVRSTIVTTEEPRNAGRIDRRRALSGAAAVGLGLPLLAACGGGSGSASDPGTTAPGGSGSSGGLAPTSDIPVGGGAIFPDQKVVVTQPTSGDFKGFSATCPHQGCLVNSVADGVIKCPCHGSTFSIEDGAPQVGPATSPLPQVQVTVKAGEINLA
jgi:nitrite reductase/ring-hydroxylating ferredoxin subunit